METLSEIASEIGAQLLDVGAALLRMVITFAVAWGISRVARQWLEPRLSRQKFGRDGAILIARLVSIIAYVIGFVSVMNQLGVNWTGLLALLSAFTVAIGLALQDMMRNFFSGILMLVERPFSVGDRVRVRDYEGEIQGIDIRTTLIRNTEGALVYIPNSIMFGEILVNRSHFQTRRLRFTITDSKRSTEELEHLVHQILSGFSDVRKPIPEPKIVSTSPEGVTLRYSLLIQASDTAEHDLMLALGTEVDDATIEIDA